MTSKPLLEIRSTFFERRTLSACLLVLLLGSYGLLATHRLSTQDFDNDQLVTSRVARLSLGELCVDRIRSGHPPAYFVAVKAWLAVTGHTPDGILLFSVALGGLGILVILALAREMELGRWAWLAALLFAVHPTLLHFARYGRPYIGVVVLGALIQYLALKSLRRPRPEDAVALFLVGILGVTWNHMLLIVWLGLLVAVAALPEARRSAKPGLWLALIGVILAHLTCIGLIAIASWGNRPIQWVERLGPAGLVEFAVELLGGRHLYDQVGIDWLLPCTVLVAVGWTLWDGLPNRRPKPGLAKEARAPSETVSREASPGARHPAGLPAPQATTGWAAESSWRLLILATLVPLGIGFLVSYTVQPILVIRYWIVLLPGMILLTTRFFGRFCRRRSMLILVGILLLQITTRDFYLNRSRTKGIRQCIDIIGQQYRADGDEAIVYFWPEWHEAFRLYAPDRSFAHYHLRSSRSGEMRWGDFDAQTADLQRLWVIDYGNTAGVLESEEWKRRTEGEFFRQQMGKVTLRGVWLRRTK